MPLKFSTDFYLDWIYKPIHKQISMSIANGIILFLICRPIEIHTMLYGVV